MSRSSLLSLMRLMPYPGLPANSEICSSVPDDTRARTTEIGVIIAGVVMWTTGWYAADPLISAGIGLFILPRTWVLLREAVGVLLEGTPSDINLTAVRTAIGSIAGVAGVHDLHVWTLTSGVNALSVHVVFADGASQNNVLAAVHQRVTADFKIAHVTVQVEVPGWEESETHL